MLERQCRLSYVAFAQTIPTIHRRSIHKHANIPTFFLVFLHRDNQRSHIVAGSIVVLLVCAIAQGERPRKPATAVNLLALREILHCGDLGRVEVDLSVANDEEKKNTLDASSAREHQLREDFFQVLISHLRSILYL